MVEFISQAADDPNVLAIKQTLYRTSADHPIVARADPRRRERQAGHGPRRAEGALRRGEQHPVGAHAGGRRASTSSTAWSASRPTARWRWSCAARATASGATSTWRPATTTRPRRAIYTDLSYFTARDEFGEDAGALFNLLTGYSRRRRGSSSRSRRVGLHEPDHRADRPRGGAGHARPDHRQDELAGRRRRSIEALYPASQAGVPIDLIVRGICCLRPGRARASARTSASSASSTGSSSTRASSTSRTAASPRSTSRRPTGCRATSSAASRSCSRSRTRGCGTGSSTGSWASL